MISDLPTMLTIGGDSVAYCVEVRPRRRHAALSVGGDGRLRVLIPTTYDPAMAEELVRQKWSWVISHVPKPHSFDADDRFLLLGEFHSLGALPGLSVGGADTPDFLLGSSRDEVRNALVRWYQSQAQAAIERRLALYSERMNVKVHALWLADYQGRWGFCRHDGVLGFSWRIVQAPLSVLDYVVVHELAHRRYMHHQRSFWSAVGSVLPDYPRDRLWLRQHGTLLLW